MSRVRLEPAVRKEQILTAAVYLAATQGLNRFTRDRVAERAGCATGLIALYFSTMCKLRRAVVGEAIRTENLNIIAQGLVAGDARIKKIPEELKRRAVESLMGV